MNVLKVAENELKIFLTDTEVKSSFGNYESLFYMSQEGRIIMSALLRDIIFKNYSLSGNESFKTKIKVQKNRGCEITVSLVRKQHKPISETMVALFYCEKDLNGLINFCLKTKNRFFDEAELWKINGKYALVIKNVNKNLNCILNEFCNFKTDDAIFCEFIKEHGKCLLKSERWENYARSFN